MADSRAVTIVIAVLIALVSVVLDQFSSVDLRSIDGFSTLTDEELAIEFASAILWIFAAVIVILAHHIQPLQSRLHLSALFLFLCAREFDLDKRFFSGGGVFQSRQYIGDAPFVEKAIGLVIIVVLLGTTVALVTRHWKDFTRALRTGKIWGYLTVVALVTVAVAKSIDGAARKLAPLGISMSQESYEVVELVEEYLELSLTLIVIVSISACSKEGRT